MTAAGLGPSRLRRGASRASDCRREHHGHSLSLAIVPGAHQLLGILQDLLLGRVACSGFLLGDLPASILHFALVEARDRDYMLVLA